MSESEISHKAAKKAFESVIGTMFAHEVLQNHIPVTDWKACDAEMVVRKGVPRSAKGSATFLVTQASLNFGGSLFGGTVGSVTDAVTSGLLLACDIATQKKPRYSVSTYLSVEYIAPVGIGERVRVEVVADKIGAQTAFTGVTFYNDATNELLYRGRHHKAYPSSPPPNSLFPEPKL